MISDLGIVAAWKVPDGMGKPRMTAEGKYVHECKCLACKWLNEKSAVCKKGWYNALVCCPADIYNADGLCVDFEARTQ